MGSISIVVRDGIIVGEVSTYVMVKINILMLIKNINCNSLTLVSVDVAIAVNVFVPVRFVLKELPTVFPIDTVSETEYAVLI